MDNNFIILPRNAVDGIFILDISGDLNASAEKPLMDAYMQATEQGARTLALNFTNLAYMNSTGIGLLVTLLIRATRARQRLLAYGLSSHYRQIFEMTRLNEAIALYESEAAAMASARSA
ncbi:MAG TPA: STAS domain-containing protein [Anaerolineaceae bacterium]